MTIKTKYDIGDTVYFLSSSGIISGIIQSLNVSMYNVDGYLRIYYDVKYHDILSAIKKAQGELFESKEELTKAL